MAMGEETDREEKSTIQEREEKGKQRRKDREEKTEKRIREHGDLFLPFSLLRGLVPSRTR